MKWKEWREFSEKTKSIESKSILKVEHIKDFCLQIWFEEKLDVSIYELDLTELLINDDPGEALHPLRDKERFATAHGNYALVWYDLETGVYDDKTIDIAPECIYFYCSKYGKRIK